MTAPSTWCVPITSTTSTLNTVTAGISINIYKSRWFPLFPKLSPPPHWTLFFSCPKWVQLYILSGSCCYITVLKVQNLVEDRFIKWNFTAKNLLLTFSTCFSIPLFYHFLAFRSQTIFSINIEHKQLAILHHQYLLLQLIQFWEIPNKYIRCHILYSFLEIDPKVK